MNIFQASNNNYTNQNNLNMNDKKIQPIPLGNNLYLLDHQRTIIYRMLEIEKTNVIEFKDNNNLIKINTSLAILSDQVASGKTFIILGLLKINNIPKEPIFNLNLQGRYFSSTQISNNCESNNSNLLILPHSIIHQWVDLIKIINIKYYLINSKKSLEEYCYKKFTENQNKVLIVSSTFLEKTLNNGILNKKWNRIILDEPQILSYHIKHLFYNNNILCNFYWLVCATPSQLIGRYIKPCFRKLFGPYNELQQLFCIQNDPDYIKESFKLPPIIHNTIECFTPNVIKYFGDKLPNKVLHLISAGCQEDALKLLGCKVNTLDNIIESLTKYYKDKLHNILALINYNNNLLISEYEKKSRNKKNIEEKKKIEEKIKGIEDRLKTINHNGQCNICLDTFNNPTTMPCCQNIFCLECILNSHKFNKVCPFCRGTINLDQLIAITNSNNLIEEVNTNPTENSNKLDKLESLLKYLELENLNKRYLVFSQYGGTFDKISTKLKESNISFDILKGSNNRIKKIIDKYIIGEIKIILLNAENFGSGLNLQMTTDIILYHNINNNLEKQIIGRAQRYGRTSSLNVTKLKYNIE